MLTYKKIVRKPKHFQSFTGITPQQFDFLSQKIQSEYQATEKKRLSRRKRERKVGAGLTIVPQDTATSNIMSWSAVESNLSDIVSQLNEYEFDKIIYLGESGMIPDRLLADRLE